MIDGELYTRTSHAKAVFAYRYDSSVDQNISLTHYAAVFYSGETFIRGVNGSKGCIATGEFRLAHEDEIDIFVTELREQGYHYNKINKKVIRINTGEIV